MNPLPPSSAYLEAITDLKRPKVFLFYLFGIILGADIYVIAFRDASLTPYSWPVFALYVCFGAMIGGYLRWRAHQEFERDAREMGWEIHHAKLAKQRQHLFASH